MVAPLSEAPVGGKPKLLDPVRQLLWVQRELALIGGRVGVKGPQD
jgi:hypothetical protein